MVEPKVSYIGVIPSSREARIGKPLNVLGGVRNDAEKECPLRVTLWGRACDVWKELISQEFILEPAFWGQEDLPEIELLTFHTQPADTVRGILIFVKK